MMKKIFFVGLIFSAFPSQAVWDVVKMLTPIGPIEGIQRKKAEEDARIMQEEKVFGIVACGKTKKSAIATNGAFSEKNRKKTVKAGSFVAIKFHDNKSQQNAEGVCSNLKGENREITEKNVTRGKTEIESSEIIEVMDKFLEKIGEKPKTDKQRKMKKNVRKFASNLATIGGKLIEGALGVNVKVDEDDVQRGEEYIVLDSGATLVETDGKCIGCE